MDVSRLGVRTTCNSCCSLVLVLRECRRFRCAPNNMVQNMACRMNVIGIGVGGVWDNRLPMNRVAEAADWCN